MIEKFLSDEDIIEIQQGIHSMLEYYKEVNPSFHGRMVGHLLWMRQEADRMKEEGYTDRAIAEFEGEKFVELLEASQEITHSITGDNE